MIGPASLLHSWHWVLFDLIHQVERRYTRMAGTVHAEAHDILAEIEDVLVRNVWEISTNQFNFFIIYNNSKRMKTSRSRYLANQRGRERSSKWITHHSEDWWETFFVHFFVKKTTRGHFFWLNVLCSWLEMAALQQTSLFQRSWMLLSCCTWRLRPCCDILTSSCSPSQGSSVAWQALQSGSVHDTKRKPCHSIRFLPGHGELQLREGALGNSHCDANRRRWWEYFSFCNSQLSFQLQIWSKRQPDSAMKTTWLGSGSMEPPGQAAIWSVSRPSLHPTSPSPWRERTALWQGMTCLPSMQTRENRQPFWDATKKKC